MADLWLSLDELLAATGWSRRTVQLKVKEGQIQWRSTRDRAANGRALREYKLSSLRTEAQRRFLSQCSSQPVAEPSAQPSASRGELVLFRPRQVEAGGPVMPTEEAHHEQINDRLEILAPLIEYLRLPSKEAKRAWRPADGQTVKNSNALAAQIATRHGISISKVWRLHRAYRTKGSSALFKAPRRDNGSSRWFAQHYDASLLVAWWYLDLRQSFRACYEALHREREILGLAEDDMPSYETVRTFLKSMPPCLKAYAREGRRKYEEMFSPYLARDYSTLTPNQIWVSDHMIHDVEVANDCFPELEWGAPMRLRFTALFDMASRYVVGYSWCPEGSSRSIATALRRAFAQWGPCEHFYCDNGRDYRKVAKGAMPGYLIDPVAIRGWHLTEVAAIEKTGLLAQLGIRVTHCIAHHPQSKHIERFFRTLHEQFDKRFWQHYTGGAPHLRPDATAAAMTLHRKALRHGEPQKSTHPAASIFVARCMEWIEQYHQRDHRGQGMNGRSPAEVFAERPAPHPLNGQSSLALLFPEHLRRKVRECAVTLNRCRYTYYDALSRDLLHEMTEREVTVAWDPNDPETVAILDENGRFLCTAQAEEMVRFDPADKDVQKRIADSMADRRHLEKATRETVVGIAREARARGFSTPVEEMDENSWLARAVGAELSGSVLTHRPPTKGQQPKVDNRPPTPAQAARLLVEALRK